jgi:hypothetical protein
MTRARAQAWAQAWAWAGAYLCGTKGLMYTHVHENIEVVTQGFHIFSVYPKSNSIVTGCLKKGWRCDQQIFMFEHIMSQPTTLKCSLRIFCAWISIFLEWIMKCRQFCNSWKWCMWSSLIIEAWEIINKCRGNVQQETHRVDAKATEGTCRVHFSVCMVCDSYLWWKNPMFTNMFKDSKCILLKN